MLNLYYRVKVHYAGNPVQVQGYDATTVRSLGSYNGELETSYITETYIRNSWYVRDYLLEFVRLVDDNQDEILVVIENLKSGIKQVVIYDMHEDDVTDLIALVER